MTGQRTLTPPAYDSYDFRELIVFAGKADREGFSYALENYPPAFTDPALAAAQTHPAAIRSLLDATDEARHTWWTEHADDGVDLHNTHIDAARARLEASRNWAVRFGNGTISTVADESTARWMSGEPSWGHPAVLYRPDADTAWQER